MSRDTTTVEVSTESWSGLNRLKGPGDSFDDVIRRLVALADDSSLEQEEGYVSGDVVLARRSRSDGSKVLTPAMIVGPKKAGEPGDYDVVYLHRLKWDTDIFENPRARAYLRDSKHVLNYSSGKLHELTELRSLVQEKQS